MTSRRRGPLASTRQRRLALLTAVTTGLALAEGAIVEAVGVDGTTVLAPQVSGIAFFGVFHDLRWVLVYHRTWWELALVAMAALAVRSAFTTLAVRLAWPDDERLPPSMRTFRVHVGITVAAYLVLSPWAAIIFGMGVVSLSTLYFFAVAPLFVVAVVTAHANVDGSWWRHLPSWRAMGWATLAFVVYVLASTAIAFGPDWSDYLAVAATGVFNAWAWRAVTTSLVHREPSPRFAPVGPVAIAATTAVLALAVSFFFGQGRDARPPTAAPTPEDGTEPVLLVAGFGSAWDGTPTDDLPAPFLDRRFSYRGLDDDGRPLPYAPAATHRSLFELVPAMRDQVRALHEATGEEVAIIAESEGTLVAKAYLGAAPDAPVDTVVLSSPLVGVSEVYYPPPGEDGWGLAGGWGVRGVTSLVSLLTAFDVSADAPLFRSILDLGPALRDVAPCPPPQARQFVLLPLGAAVTTPPIDPPVPVEVVVALHGQTFEPANRNATVRDMLTGEFRAPTGPLDVVRRVVAGAALAWQVPELPVELNPVWSAFDAELTDGSVPCGTAFRILQERLLPATGR